MGNWTATTEAFTERTLSEFEALLRAPLVAPDILWIIFPLAVTAFVMILYFGVYRKEDMGWNTALGNSVVLLFVVMDLLKLMYNYTDPASVLNYLDHPMKVGFIALITLEAIFLIIITSRHAIPKAIAFFLTSPISINSQAYVLITVVYTRHEPSWYLFSAGFLLFLCALALSGFIHLWQYVVINLHHKRMIARAKALRHEAGSLKGAASKAKGRKKEELKEEISEMLEEAKELEKTVKEQRKERFKQTSSDES